MAGKRPFVQVVNDLLVELKMTHATSHPGHVLCDLCARIRETTEAAREEVVRLQHDDQIIRKALRDLVAVGKRKPNT